MNIDKLVELEQQIKKLGTGRESFLLRWEFGRECHRLFGQKMATAYFQYVTAHTGVLRYEIEFRKRAATKFPTHASFIEASAEPLLTTWRRFLLEAVFGNEPVSEKRAVRAVHGRYGTNPRVVSACLALGEQNTAKTYEQIAAAWGSNAKTLGSVNDFLRQAAMLPWMKIVKGDGVIVFEVDHDLRELCDTWTAGAVGSLSIGQHLANLRADITRVRYENKCQRNRQRWNPDDQKVGDLIALIDHIEVELDKIPAPKCSQPSTRPARLHDDAGLNHVAQPQETEQVTVC